MSKMKMPFRNIIDWLLERDSRTSRSLLSILASSFATLNDRQLFRVYFDGVDWICLGKRNALVSGRPIFHPEEHLMGNMKLFTHHYLPKTGDVVFDVGAGSGTEIPFLSQSIGSTGKVFAIESDIDAVRRLNKLVKLIKANNVEIVHCGVSSSDGVGYMLQKEHGGISGRLIGMSMSISVDKSNEIQVRTMDAIIQELGIEKIDFLKMNIEGSEYEALLGFAKNLNKVENWCVSCHDFLQVDPIQTHQQVVELLIENNCQILPNPYVEESTFRSFYVYAKQNLNLPS